MSDRTGKPRWLRCACCGDDAGKFIQWHNQDDGFGLCARCADWIIDLGPEGGDAGGQLVFAGLPEDLVKEKKSYTGKYLKEKL